MPYIWEGTPGSRRKILFKLSLPGKLSISFTRVVNLGPTPTARSADVVFSISDQRAEQEFNVYVRYDINAYPELKNGMSAKIWVYK